MAQAEDTELRDLVIEALEKNGSLAKVRALLRANVFLAFENECENMKLNACLDKILKIPEGIVALSIVHEFLEFCNLKNTLFVYKAESRQKKEYFYQGKKVLSEKLKLNAEGQKEDEPILVSLIKKSLRLCSDNNPIDKDINKDEQNCTYIVHEYSASTISSSQSDTSSDEKNKLHLRLQLDNSDTDTSSESTRDKQCSEYIPSEHIIQETADTEQKSKSKISETVYLQELPKVSVSNKEITPFLYELKHSHSSDSTSHIDLKSSQSEVKNSGSEMKNIKDSTIDLQLFQGKPKDQLNTIDLLSSASISNISTLSKNDNLSENTANTSQKFPMEHNKSNSEYSLDFTSSSNNKNKEESEKIESHKSVLEEDMPNSPNKGSPLDNSQHNSPRSLSSVSISDVADLISERSLSSDHHYKNDTANKSKLSPSNSPKRGLNLDSNKISDDSGDFSESPIPSLSNLSLDMHSD